MQLTPTLVDLPVASQPWELIIPPCQLCSRNDRRPCHYRAGFLYCITHNCSSPHHRNDR